MPMRMIENESNESKYPIGTHLVQADWLDGICIQRVEAEVIGYTHGEYRLRITEDVTISRALLESGPFRPW